MPEVSTGAARSVPALPATVQGLIAQRRSPRTQTLNDFVENVHLALWPNGAYRAALDATHDADAVEGSLAADNFLAAQMIRDYARENNMSFVSTKKLAVILHALKIVMRRYNISRHIRANSIGGVEMDERGGFAPHPDRVDDEEAAE